MQYRLAPAARPVRLRTALLGSAFVTLIASAEEPTQPESDQVLTLQAIDIQGEAYQPQTTEGSGSYTTGAMSTAIGLPLSIKETPQSVSVVTRQQIEDQELTTTADILNTAPGVSYTRNDSNRLSFSARGFTIDNFQFDGLASPINGLWNFGATEICGILAPPKWIRQSTTGSKWYAAPQAC
ncbi:Ferripyoverdine receptor precursor [compost metagenome]